MINARKEYTHILFDADNTLLDFNKGEKTALEQTFQTLGITFDEAIYNLYLEINHKAWQEYEAGEIDTDTVQDKRFRELFRAVNFELDSTSANRTYQSFLSEQSCLEPFAQEICEYWSKKATISIITNGVTETQKKRIMSSTIWPYISHLIISEELGVSKPNPAFFIKAFKIIHCQDPRNVLVVGDSLSSDILGAMNAGVDCCWYNPRGTVLPERYSINYQIDKLEQLQLLSDLEVRNSV